MTGTVLLTGATGYIGSRVAARLLAETDDRLVLTVRTPHQTPGVLAELGAAATGRVDVVTADLAGADPFAAVDPAGVTRILHAAALTAFNVGREDARAVNVDGTAALARFAHRCPRLERLLAVSTLYSVGRRTGSVAEEPHPADATFVNNYEWSKAQAEAHLFATCADLPLAVARLATVVADDDSGRVGQYNAFHNTLKLFFYGLLSLMPGDPKTQLYLATADFTAAGTVHLLRPDVPGGVYHLSPGPAETSTLGELIGLAFDTFEADPGFRRRRLLRPEFCSIDGFRDLAAASRGLRSSPLAQALESVTPFAEQMFLPKEFATDHLHQFWPERPTTDGWALATAATAHLVRTRWGRTAEERA